LEEKLKFAVFIDFDNIEIGVKTTLGREFDVALVLEALKERGEVITKVAYGNWKMAGRHSEKMAAHAVQMVQRDPSPRGDKNGADINLALDALEMAFTRDFINAFAIVGGDSDFIALVEKLKQYNKNVYILGGRGFTSTILQKNCKEFIAYENLISESAPAHSHTKEERHRGRRPGGDALPLTQAIPLLARAMKVLADREHEPLLGLVKSTMMQLDSTFTERDYGVSSFLDFAEKLAGAGLARLVRSNGNHLLTLAGEAAGTVPAPVSREEAALAVLKAALEEAAQRGRREFHQHGLKQFLSKIRPGFDERKYGFKQFSALLNLAHDRGIVSIAPDERGAMRVRTVLEEAPAVETVPVEEPPVVETEMDVEPTAPPAEESLPASEMESEPAFELTPPEPEPPKKRRRAPARPRPPRKKKAQP
jgi:uncharacterized protein (TIGR00288 family)